MNAVLKFLTSRGTTLAAVVAGLALLLADQMFVDELTKIGIPDSVVGRLISGAKIATYVLAALGYSPLKRPAPETPSP